MRWPTAQSTTRPHFGVLQGRFSPFRLRPTFMRHPTRSTICFANSGRLALNAAVSPKITLAWRKLLTLTGRRNPKSLLTRFLSGFHHGRVSLNVEDIAPPPSVSRSTMKLYLTGTSPLRLRSLSGFFCFFGLRIDGLHRLGCYRRRWSHRSVNNLPIDAI